MPSLNNPNHVFDIYGESDSDIIYIEDFSKGEARKNSKEYDYTSMDLEKEGKQADLQELNITRYRHDIPRKKGENEKALVTKEMGLGFLEKIIFIGDSAATSHMTNRKLGVYDLVPINGSVMIGNGKSINVLKIPVLDSSRSPALRGSSTLLGSPVIFSQDCLFTCIFHSL